MKVRLSTLREYLFENLFLLAEGRIEDAREKYPDMEDENFDFLVANQPAGSNNKYLMWMCKQADDLLEVDPDPQGLQLVSNAVRLFDGNKQRLEKKDINQYKDVAEVEAAIEKLGGASKNQQAKQARADTDTIYNDDRFTVLRPHTTEASCKYGVGTRWCIAATASHNYFNTYSNSNNKFYFVIDKKAEPNATTSKFAIVINEEPTTDNSSRIQVFNAPDKQVGLGAVIKHCGDKWPAIWEKIKQHVKSQPLTREVEDSRKAVEEHVKSFMNGENVSKESLKKIASDAKLTTPIVLKLIKYMKEYTGPNDYTNPQTAIVQALVHRASELPGDGALALIKHIASTKPENADWWSGRYHLETLIGQSPLSPEAFHELAQSGEDTTLSLILRNPNCPQDIITGLAERLPELQEIGLKKNVYSALIRSGIINDEQMRAAMTIDGGSMIYQVLYNSDMTDKLSPEMLRLIPIRSSGDMKRMLSLPNAPPDLVADLISTHWKKLSKKELYELLRDVNLPPEMIERIWAGKDPHVRISLLQNPSIGAENASTFVNSRNSAYRFAVAHNSALPGEGLRTLAGDESASTRAAVGSNPNTPEEALRTLSRDEATVVRASVASNSKTPRSILDTLKKDSDDFVRKSARKTLKSFETIENLVHMMTSMQGVLSEAITDDEEDTNTMVPHWTEIPAGSIKAVEFVAIYLLQNNGHAIREDIEAAFQTWNPQHPTTRYVGGRRRFGRRQPVAVAAKNVWQIIKQDDYNDSSRSITSGGKGWWWSPAGINKGAMFRLTPSGTSAALESLNKVRQTYSSRQWSTKERPAVKTSSPSREPVARAAGEPTAPRGPKTTYKIYGKFKGHPAATRLKGQAYVAPAGTQFRSGDQAVLTPGDDGKLKVKKPDSDHTQTWDPIDG